MVRSSSSTATSSSRSPRRNRRRRQINKDTTFLPISPTPLHWLGCRGLGAANWPAFRGTNRRRRRRGADWDLASRTSPGRRRFPAWRIEPDRLGRSRLRHDGRRSRRPGKAGDVDEAGIDRRRWHLRRAATAGQDRAARHQVKASMKRHVGHRSRADRPVARAEPVLLRRQSEVADRPRRDGRRPRRRPELSVGPRQLAGDLRRPVIVQNDATRIRSSPPTISPPARRSGGRRTTSTRRGRRR